MKRTVVMLIAGFALLVGGRLGVRRIHSFSAEYDSGQRCRDPGVVTQFVLAQSAFVRDD